MITVADGYTSHPFFCAKSFSVLFSEGIWRLRLYPVLKAGNKSVLLVSTSDGFKVHFQNDVAVFTVSAGSTFLFEWRLIGCLSQSGSSLQLEASLSLWLTASGNFPTYKEIVLQRHYV